MKILIILNCIIISIASLAFFSQHDIAKYTAKHVVIVNDFTGSGTGFYVMYEGKSYLITNNHVCGSSDGMLTVDGYSKVIALSKKHDLCMLDSLRSVGLRIEQTELSVLDKVIVVGHPIGNPVTSRSGRYVGIDKSVLESISTDEVDSLIFSVTILGGSSGSPVINDYGMVVGVAFAYSSASKFDTFAVPNRYLLEFLEENKR